MKDKIGDQFEDADGNVYTVTDIGGSVKITEDIQEVTDFGETWYIVADLAEYAMDHPEETVQSAFETRAEAEAAWVAFKEKGHG